MKWIIQDWAGNELTAFGYFETFQDGWGAIYTAFEDEAEYDELYVVEKDK